MPQNFTLWVSPPLRIGWPRPGNVDTDRALSELPDASSGQCINMLFGCPPPQAKMRCVEWACFVPDPTPRSCDVDDPTPFKYPNSDSPVMAKPGWDVTKDSRCYCTRYEWYL